jgi:hypothetical protein
VSVTCSNGSVCEKIVKFYSVDGLGNTEEVKTTDIIQIDKKSPTISVTNPDNTCAASKIVKASVTDANA